MSRQIKQENSLEQWGLRRQYIAIYFRYGNLIIPHRTGYIYTLHARDFHYKSDSVKKMLYRLAYLPSLVYINRQKDPYDNFQNRAAH